MRATAQVAARRGPGGRAGLDAEAARPRRARRSPAQLLAAAAARPARPLPHRAALEAGVGHSLADVRVYANAESRAALHRLGAVAAVQGRALFLTTPDPGLDVLAHEAVHLAQVARASDAATEPGVDVPDRDVERHDREGTIARTNAATRAKEQGANVAFARGNVPTRADGQGGLPDVVAAGAAAEREAHRLAPAVHRGLVTGDRPVPVTAALDRGALALLRRSRAEVAVRAEAPAPADALATAAFVRVAARAGADETVTETATGTATETAAPADGAAADALRAAEPPVPAAAVAADAMPAPGLPAEPDTVPAPPPPAAAAAPVPALAPTAETPAALVDAFVAAPPSVKAAAAGTLGDELGRVTAAAEEKQRTALPSLTATLDGAAPRPPAPPVAPPPAAPVVLAPTPEPVPTVETPPTPAPTPTDANPLLLSGLARTADAQPADRAQDLARRMGSVATTDPTVSASAGPPPQVPLTGGSDPGRIDEQLTTGSATARESLDSARSAVLDGRGPEQVPTAQVEQVHALDGLDAPARTAPEIPAGPAQLVAMGLPADVTATLDRQQHATMQANLAAAREQVAAATAERDTKNTEAVGAATAQVDALNRQADADQRAQVQDSRAQVQTARQDALDRQAAGVTDLEKQAADRRGTDRTALRERVASDEKQVQDRYRTAEQDARKEIDDGERRATAERTRTEEKATEQSWWDRAVDAVASALTALKNAINAVLDAVKAAVNKVLDAAKAFATRLIEAAAKWVNEAIAAFGTFLKGLVDGLLGELFPRLAAALNAAIDKAVSLAQAAVNVIAAKLTAAVAAFVEGLRAGLNAIVAAYQGALNAAFALVGAVLTGDWSAVGRMVLDAVLGLLGIDPAEFAALVGKAQGTIQAIVDRPGVFVSNLIAAFVGGIRLFAGNFLTHLKAGVVAWLAGALGGAGLTLPERFDLLGVLDLLRQIVGLTWARLRERGERLLGPRAIAMIEQLGSYFQTLAEEGWAGLFTRIREDLSGLVDTALGALRTMLVEKVVTAAVTKLVTLFNPVGAIVQLVLTAWNFYTFLRDQLRRIFEVVRAVVDALDRIVAGVLGPASQAVEATLGRLLPLALDLLARLLGLGDIGTRIREVLTKIQTGVDKAIDKLLAKAVGALRGGRAPAKTATEPTPGRIDEEFTVGTERHHVFADASGRLMVASTTPHPLAGHKDQKVQAAYKAVVAAKNPTARDTALDALVAAVRAWMAAAGKTEPGHSAPGIGEVDRHTAQQPRLRTSGILVWELESEHVLPFDHLLGILEGLVPGWFAANPKRFRTETYQQMHTVLLYRGASKGKTNGPGGDNSTRFYLRAVFVGQRAVDAAKGRPPSTWPRIEAAIRTNVVLNVRRNLPGAIKGEWATQVNGLANGQARGEPLPMPDWRRVEDAMAKQIADVREFVTTTAGVAP